MRTTLQFGTNSVLMTSEIAILGRQVLWCDVMFSVSIFLKGINISIEGEDWNYF